MIAVTFESMRSGVSILDFQTFRFLKLFCLQGVEVCPAEVGRGSITQAFRLWVLPVPYCPCRESNSAISFGTAELRSVGMGLRLIGPGSERRRDVTVTSQRCPTPVVSKAQGVKRVLAHFTTHRFVHWHFDSVSMAWGGRVKIGMDRAASYSKPL